MAHFKILESNGALIALLATVAGIAWWIGSSVTAHEAQMQTAIDALEKKVMTLEQNAGSIEISNRRIAKLNESMNLVAGSIRAIEKAQGLEAALKVTLSEMKRPQSQKKSLEVKEVVGESDTQAN